MAVATIEKSLSREAAGEVAARAGEPQWLLRGRLEAWDTFDLVPWPDASQEEWRRVNLAGLKLDAYRPYAPAGPGGEDALPEALRPVVPSPAGLVVQHNSEAAFARLSAELERQGVLFTSLSEAVRRHPELVRKHLNRVAGPAMGKFEALNGAFWEGGVFLYVPRNVSVQVPLYATTWEDAPGLALFPRTLVVAEEGSEVTLFDDHASADGGEETFSCPLAEVVVGDAAHVRYVTLQRWGRHVREFGTRRAVVGRDAAFEWVSVILGSRQSKMRLQAAFAGQGSESTLRGLYFPTGDQEIQVATLQDHEAPRTRSDLYFKGALRDAARSVYYGVIRVHPEAQQTNGYQQNRNLLLSDKAKADSIPILEIEANDVKCSHGATVGQVDPEQLFYLMARGLPRPEAERLLVEAFFHEVLDVIPDQDARERVAALLGARASGGR